MRTWAPIIGSSLLAFVIAFGGTLFVGGDPAAATSAGLLVGVLSAGLLSSQVLRREGTFDPRRRERERERGDGRGRGGSDRR